MTRDNKEPKLPKWWLLSKLSEHSVELEYKGDRIKIFVDGDIVLETYLKVRGDADYSRSSCILNFRNFCPRGESDR